MGLANEATPGITWLELLVLFEIFGNTLEQDTGSSDEAQSSKGVAPRLSLNNNLQLFKQLFQYVAANCVNEVDGVYFRATKAPTRRLSSLAIYQNMPGIGSIPRLTDELAEAVARHNILAKGKHITQRKLGQLAVGGLVLLMLALVVPYCALVACTRGLCFSCSDSSALFALALLDTYAT